MKMYKRFGSNAMMVIFAMLFGFAVMVIGTETAHAMEGNGTIENPYKISTYAELKEFAKIVNGTHSEIAQNASACAKLTADIECDDGEWEPIGTQANPYAGTFDGKGMTIEKLSNEEREPDVRQGLFGTASSGAIIQNIGLKDINIKSAGLSGGIVGDNKGTIQNCHVTGAVSRSKWNYNAGYVGGVAGQNYGTIKNCYNTGDVSGTGDQSYCVGGVAGENYGTIENCYNTGDVSGTDDRSNAVGGVAGSNDGTIKNCYSTGNVSGTGDQSYNVGGVAGRNDSGGTITNCYVTGTVSGSDNVGGVAGRNGETITNCYNTGDVSGNGNQVGGVAGLSAGKIENCYNTGSVSGNKNVGGVAGRNGGPITNCYNTGSVSGNENVGGVAGDNSRTITNCYYDNVLCKLDKAIGVQNGTANNVEGLTTDQMTGTGALNNMEFVYGTGETSPWMVKETDTKAKYYPHIKGFNFDGEGQQMDPADISTYDWPARIDLMVATPVFSPESGVFYPEQSVTISCETKDAAIYYTTDGTAPTTSGNKYTEAIPITETTTIKAIAVKDGLANSEVAAATYIKMQGDGSSEDPYQITNYAELKTFAGIVNGAYPSIAQNPAACAILTADIDASSSGDWVPIGRFPPKYTGTFDGQGHTIRKLNNGECTNDNQGLFGRIGSGGIVQNVGLEDISIKGGECVGGVAGTNEGGTIENCYKTGTVSGDSEIGGVAGTNEGGTIENCYNTGTVRGSMHGTGGVAGYNSEGTITNCYNTGTVSGDAIVGGVAGFNDWGGTIKNCYNTGDVSGSGDDVGGVAGFNHPYGTVTNCFSTGYVKGNGHVGGVAGWNNDGTVTNCYYDAELCKDKKAIGTAADTEYVKGLTTEEMTGKGALNNMPFVYGTGETPPWMEKANDENARYYPHLKGFNFDDDGKQMDAKDISSDNWPPKTDALVVETPAFSPAAGDFGPQRSITISCATDGAAIYYTTDGSDPTTSSNKYTEPITISDTTIIKAFAVKEGAVDSEVATATYTHVHKYGAWTKLNATQHQKVCEHDDTHVEKENHTWNTEWSADGENHWHECSICGAHKDEAAHSGGTATCKEKAKCEVCNGEYGDLGEHKYSAWKNLDATQHQRVCEHDKTHIEKANHSWDAGKVTKPEKCTEKGEKTFTCTVEGCKATKTEEIKAKGHTEVVDKAVPATCTNTGLTEGKHCSVCNEVLVIQETVPATGHKWDEGKVTKEATETSEGIKTYTCTVCGETKTEAIPKLDPKPEPKPTPTPTPKPTPAPVKVSGKLLPKIVAKKNSMTISWNKIKGVAGYDIFFARCNHDKKKIVAKKAKTIKGNKTFKWTKSGLKKGTAYKAYVRAYVYKNGKKSYVRTSPLMHAYTGNGTKKYTNAKSVSVNKTKVTLKKGKTFKIKAKVSKVKKNKKLMPKGHAAKLRYMTSNKKIATVSKSGKIKAKAKGTCDIYVYAHNGVSKQIKVTVK